MCVCTCVCVCACACVFACVCVCVRLRACVFLMLVRIFWYFLIFYTMKNIDGNLVFFKVVLSLYSTLNDGDTCQVTIEVRDTGVGIPAVQQTHLFEPFFQGMIISQEEISVKILCIQKITMHLTRVHLGYHLLWLVTPFHRTLCFYF